FDNIRDILLTVKEKFGTPSGSISDMRSGILKAIGDVFHGIPIRICLLHFLRDLGKDLMESMHTDLGMMINRKGIKSPLKSILRSIPDYDQATLTEIEQGFCSSRENMEFMAIRKILEPVLTVNGSSGYGFPFSLNNLNFFTVCKGAGKRLSDLSGKIRETESMKLINSVEEQINRIIKDQEIVETADRLSDVNMLFRKIRSAFRMPEKGNLSDDIEDDSSIHDQCNIVIAEMEVYLNVNIPPHMFIAPK
ncbi:MULE transposase, conserved domain protein, partial [mine drainage metagenome]